ncbi:BadF/BadG/BcrA/BcrD ATPase family protein [Kiloniella majae]|uniref:BadF/BadG/BcrA/BcrD ATPase family protein n=1 Tax=Kiloniella majae TaxID=1938558 RepID=UPI000A279457|nr:BadF/BadG/BcrA/BcrD ATPase family protein [Kiloniella majae]
MANEMLYAGVDGGGTSCRVRIENANRDILGEGFAGPSNSRLGAVRVYYEIEKACLEALHQSGRGREDFASLHVGLGLAGLGLESELQAMLSFPHSFASVSGATDAYTACLGAHAGENGGILILGTGSCGLGIVKDDVINVGGWGFEISDHASGAVLGLTAVRSALFAAEGCRPETPLTKAIMAHFKNDRQVMVKWAEEAEPHHYGSFAPLIFDHADEGDELAGRIVAKSVHEAGCMIQALLDRGVEAVCLMGGVSKRIAPKLPEKYQKILSKPRGDAMDGAIRMVRKSAFSGQEASK